MNTFLTLFGLLLLGFIGYVGFVTYSLFLNVDDASYCSVDADCAVVESADACPEILSISRDYESAWLRKVKYTKWLYNIVSIKSCPLPDKEKYESICLENKCIARESVLWEE
ncbi:hypothetical protein HYV79_04440 [Candidatus Woesearchaeota archaeon]|nr:hypothetical protein [Candidatus Woesearchaeota archaeon]